MQTKLCASPISFSLFTFWRQWLVGHPGQIKSFFLFCRIKPKNSYCVELTSSSYCCIFSTSVWVLRTPSPGWNLLNCVLTPFSKFLVQKWWKMSVWGLILKRWLTQKCCVVNTNVKSLQVFNLFKANISLSYVYLECAC